MLSWMAWTWPTALVFIFVFGAIGTLLVIELFRPGGGLRKGIIGLVTTRGDRLFISLLGSVFIFLGWIFFYGVPLWGGLVIALIWSAIVFWKV